MGFVNEVSQFLIKYGEIALNKTEIFTQLVKLKIELKKREMDIEKIKIEAGEYAISQYEKKEPIQEDVIKSMSEKINIVSQEIGEYKIKLDNIKSQLRESGSDIKK